MKQLTLEELRKQFEREQKKYPMVNLRQENENYIDGYTWHLWKGYQECAKLNGILKDI